MPRSWETWRRAQGCLSPWRWRRWLGFYRDRGRSRLAGAFESLSADAGARRVWRGSFSWPCVYCVFAAELDSLARVLGRFIWRRIHCCWFEHRLRHSGTLGRGVSWADVRDLGLHTASPSSAGAVWHPGGAAQSCRVVQLIYRGRLMGRPLGAGQQTPAKFGREKVAACFGAVGPAAAPPHREKNCARKKPHP